jgi:predicted permease
VLKTPALLALLPALLFNWLDLTPPLVLVRSTGLLAEAMVPTMLLTLGVQLAGIGLPRFDRDVIIASAIRLLTGPCLAMILAAPFALTGLERGTGILQAGMPAAVFASIIALENDLLPDFVTTTVLFSTLASLITLTVLLALV